MFEARTYCRNGPEILAVLPRLLRLAQLCESEAEFNASFGTEEACRRWLATARWPTGFVCPHCGGGGGWIASRKVYQCGRCRRQTSLTSGTIFQGTRKPLKTWFEAAYLVVQRGVNARTLQTELQLTYKVAWNWAHKLRGAMTEQVVPEEAGPRERVRLEPTRVRDYHERSFAASCACPRLLKRDWGYTNDMEEDRAAREWENLFYHGLVNRNDRLPEDYPPVGSSRETLELLATYSGSISEKHLRAYTNEVAFRWNRRARPQPERFSSFALLLARTPPRTYKAVTRRERPEGHPLSIVSLPPFPKLTEPRLVPV
jgi:transposase-like protein